MVHIATSEGQYQTRKEACRGRDGDMEPGDLGGGVFWKRKTKKEKNPRGDSSETKRRNTEGRKGSRDSVRGDQEPLVLQ